MREASLNLKREFPRIPFYADYKEKVADLLLRVTSVSVKTVAMTEAMKRAPR